MRKRLRVAALILVMALLFSGCSWIFDVVLGSDVVAFQDMEYVRPDMAALEQVRLDACEAAESSKIFGMVVDKIYAYYQAYDDFYTNYALADIHYSCNLTDLYWETEYNYCLDNTAAVDAGLEELYYALAASPHREKLEEDALFGEGFFDAYEGESLWSEAFLELMEQESALQGQYYELMAQAQAVEYYSEEYFSVYGTQMADILVELVEVRQQIAAEAGYESYPAFAYDMYHYRDYTPQQAEAYMLQIGEQMYDLYYRVNQSGVWDLGYTYCSEEDTFAYVKNTAENMGGYPREAFALMEEAGLYDIAYGENKMSGAFETYLWNYYEPFVFLSPYQDQSDKLAFAHEFGHFANDYVCYGSTAGTDVAEVHSQAMEYLSLLYAEETEELTVYKMADCLSIYVEQAAYGLFEQQIYDLRGDALTVENIQALYEEIGTSFGFDSWAWDSRDYVMVSHFYTSPMYIVSYVVSNDVAFQMYQMEQEETGAGLAVYEQCLESMDSYLLTFAETYGLESPFAEGRLEQSVQTLTKELESYI